MTTLYRLLIRRALVNDWIFAAFDLLTPQKEMQS